MKPAAAESQLIKWVNEQPVIWAAFTLKCPRFRSTERWDRLLKDAFNIIENTYVKSPMQQRRKNNEEPLLRRVVHLGGDSDNGIAIHAQGLVELIDDDMDRLQQKMTKSWFTAVRSNERFLPKSNVPLAQDAKVWVQRYESHDGYLQYLNRFEGSNLGFGVNKVVWSATSLKA